MLHCFLGMEHGGYAAENNLDAPGPVLISNFPASLDLDSEHHGDTHKINLFVKVNFLQIFIHKVDINKVGQGSGKNHWAVGRQVKFRLAAELWPSGIYEFKFHYVYRRSGEIIYYGPFLTTYCSEGFYYFQL